MKQEWRIVDLLPCLSKTQLWRWAQFRPTTRYQLFGCFPASAAGKRRKGRPSPCRVQRKEGGVRRRLERCHAMRANLPRYFPSGRSAGSSGAKPGIPLPPIGLSLLPLVFPLCSPIPQAASPITDHQCVVQGTKGELGGISEAAWAQESWGWGGVLDIHPEGKSQRLGQHLP